MNFVVSVVKSDMKYTSTTCDLCGLTLRFGNASLEASGKTYHFCCMGCRQVFLMLLEATDSGDPAQFKETELFKKCREMGIIPGSDEDLRQRVSSSADAADYSVPSIQPAAEHSESDSRLAAADNTLSLQLKLNDMWCPACAWVIDETLKKSPGVVASSCNFSTDRLHCVYDPVKTSPSQIIESVEKLGYRVHMPGDESGTAESRREVIRFAVSTFLTMNVMMLSFALYSGFFSQLSRDAIAKLSWPIFFMATVVLFYGGRNIYKKAFTGFTAAASGMEALIAVSASSAYIYSTYNLLRGNIHLYFDTAAMLITLVLLGKLLERRAKNSILEDLENFFSLRPTKVRICTDRYPRGRYISAEQLQKDDIFRVEESEIVPADGIIIEGSGRVDESSLTGEPLPVKKESGSRIRSGTRIARGNFKVKAGAVGDDSTLGQMIRIVEQALGQKTPLEGRTDRILTWFVPLIIGLAIGTGVISYVIGFPLDQAIIRAVTVMVISCPCALGVAIPLARVAGISVAGRIGILVRDFSAFEQAQRVDTFVFDKTGTITSGQWQLQEIILPGEYTRQQILAMAAALEQNSDHYIALEIRRQAKNDGVLPAAISEIIAGENGLSGRFDNKMIKIGSKGFISNEINASNPTFDTGALEFDAEPSMVYMSSGGKLCAVFVFGDTVREGAHTTVERLKTLGHKLALVSGDGQRITRVVGESVGIAETYGDQLPRAKAVLIENLRNRGRRVAMVGDGVNDAPALARADLAIAVHSGSHLGKEVADITLMRGEPHQILDFLQLAEKTNKKVNQNLWCSFIYNVIAIPVAMSGLLTPLVAVCAMLLSSLSVTGNTFLLIRSYSR